MQDCRDGIGIAGIAMGGSWKLEQTFPLVVLSEPVLSYDVPEALTLCSTDDREMSMSLIPETCSILVSSSHIPTKRY